MKEKSNDLFERDSKIERLISVRPSERQLRHAEKPFYLFIHFGMNTSTGREWGNGSETVDDFKITEIHPDQWVEVALSAQASGLILTAKHHDGFCLFETKETDFSVMNTALGTDVVRALSDECRKVGLDFGVYLSPWDMHEKSYGTEKYNDFFVSQLKELLSNYGEIFEVWFDGAKGENAVDFEYDWERYYSVVRELQPNACISICGPDLRWVGNEAGKTRKSEFSVVPAYLTDAEKTHEKSQHSPDEAKKMKKLTSKDEDLGSRKVLRDQPDLVWYPAEVDVSIRDGWFHPGGGHVKSAKKLFEIFLNSVGNNCSLLLNVPPNKEGLIEDEDLHSLSALGEMIERMTQKPLAVISPGELESNTVAVDFETSSNVRFCIIEEEISKSQRIESFELVIYNKERRTTFRHRGTVIGSRKIIPVGAEGIKAGLIIKQSRSTPIIKKIGFYA